eukprot:NODE_10024_length_546_cov_171.858156_g9379_i0.p1 GENE.NODE_10024_length_546_cov_171.858156_g9379_i0~~NODE_10024_length_546_cov_171.858156_g9379_i0.p1  ORF type:complete len:139 (+),score=16.41 NODE_10024_length_546_cov_171.858156_g9379_i0:70-486(+)
MIRTVSRILTTRGTRLFMVRPTVIPRIPFQVRWGHDSHDDDHGHGHGHGPSATGLHFLPRDVVTARVLKVISEFDKVAKIPKIEDHFVNDLGLDSLDVVELVMALEMEFQTEIHTTEAEMIETVKDAIDFFCGHPKAH